MRALWAAMAVLVACDRGHPPEHLAAAPAAPVAAAACNLAPIPLRYPAPHRLAAIGDLHGDLGGARAALRAAGAIDDHDHWSGGDLVVVQTGDVLDRGDDEQAILDLLDRLEGEAHAAGGALIVLIGNHELMNAARDFRYVTPGGFRDFDDAPGLDRERWKDVPESQRSRVAAFAPGGAYAKWIARHAVVAIVGDTVFSHAGVLGDWVLHVDEVNQSARCWLDGQSGDSDHQPPVLTSDSSPVWTRAAGTEAVDCATVAAALGALGVKRMVVGHTVQKAGISSACGGTVWQIDVGLAKLYDGPIQVLGIVGDEPAILTGTRIR